MIGCLLNDFNARSILIRKLTDNIIEECINIVTKGANFRDASFLSERL